MKACKILIVEDELLIAADIESSLSLAGHKVVGTATNSKEAVSLVETAAPDLVLMDIQLRGAENGIQTANTIRERWEIPVVFLTANTDEQTLSKARAVGPYGFLSKPFRSDELAQTVRIAIEQSQRVQKLFASQRWLTTVLDSLTDAVIVTDVKARVRYMNPAAESITGWTPIEAAGRPIEEVYPLSGFDGKPVQECLLRRTLRTGNFVGKSRFLLNTKTRGKVPIEDSAAPIREHDQLVGAVTIFLDISDRLASERQQEIEKDRLEERAHVATMALGETRADLRALAGNLLTTQEQERQRIARELHDDFGQRTALLGMLIDRAARETGLESASLQELRTQITQLSSGLREVSHRLHPSILADLGLPVALRSLVERERQTGRDVVFAQTDVPDALPLATATALYRIAQEALRNAAKHAPGTSVEVVLARKQNELELRVRDNGPGFSLHVRAKGALGLVSMQERARMAGGSLSIHTSPGEGADLLVRVPLAAEPALHRE